METQKELILIIFLSFQGVDNDQGVSVVEVSLFLICFTVLMKNSLCP